MNARVSLSAVKQPGITKAFEEIIGFEGDEFYTKVWPEVTGQAFDLMAGHFPDCIPLGVKNANGDVTLCPRSDYVMKETDGLIVLAEDRYTRQMCSYYISLFYPTFYWFLFVKMGR